MKQYIKLFEQFICENSESTYDYGCVMVYFNFPQLKDIHSKIDEEDIYTEEGDKTYGIENEPHATILYGIHSDEVKDNEIINTLKGSDVGKIILHNASLFENEKYDVLKLDAFNGNLHKLNKELQKFPFTSDYPEYHPHATISYIKKGKGKKYVDMFKDKHFEVTPSKFVYSKPDGSKVEQQISNEIKEDKGYLGDGVGIMYEPDQQIMYIGSSNNKDINYTIFDIKDDSEVLEIKNTLKNIDPSDWNNLLIEAGYKVEPGRNYFVLTNTIS